MAIGEIFKMAVYSLIEGSLKDREKLLESDKSPEELAEELGIELEKFEEPEELRSYLEKKFRNEKLAEPKKLAEVATMHMKSAVEDLEDRILYPEID